MDVIRQFESIVPKIAEKFDAVEVLYLFGSYASGRASCGSDVDVAIFVDDCAYMDDPLLDLEIGVLLEGQLDRAVDVVVMNRVSPVLQHEVLRSGRRMFERSAARRAVYELTSFKNYLDSKHYQRKRAGCGA